MWKNAIAAEALLIVENEFYTIHEWLNIYNATVRSPAGRGLLGRNKDTYQVTNAFQGPTYAPDVESATWAKAEFYRLAARATSTGSLGFTYFKSQPGRGGTSRLPTPRMAQAGTTARLNATVSLWEFVSWRFYREIIADGHNVPIWRRDYAIIWGLSRDETRRVVLMEPYPINNIV